MSENLTKREIISDRTTIKTLIRARGICRSEHMLLKAINNDKPYSRIFIIPVRRGASMRAVDRNRLRRIGKDLFRKNKLVAGGKSMDYALFLFKPLLEVAHANRERIYRALIGEAHARH